MNTSRDKVMRLGNRDARGVSQVSLAPKSSGESLRVNLNLKTIRARMRDSDWRVLVCGRPRMFCRSSRNKTVYVPASRYIKKCGCARKNDAMSGLPAYFWPD